MSAPWWEAHLQAALPVFITATDWDRECDPGRFDGLVVTPRLLATAVLQYGTGVWARWNHEEADEARLYVDLLATLAGDAEAWAARKAFLLRRQGEARRSARRQRRRVEFAGLVRAWRACLRLRYLPWGPTRPGRSIGVDRLSARDRRTLVRLWMVQHLPGAAGVESPWWSPWVRLDGPTLRAMYADAALRGRRGLPVVRVVGPLDRPRVPRFEAEIATAAARQELFLGADRPRRRVGWDDEAPETAEASERRRAFRQHWAARRRANP